MEDKLQRAALSRLLSSGVWVSGLLMAGGLLAALVPGARPGAGHAAIRWGILALIATPALGVVLSAGASARRREWRYLAVCLGILALMGLSLVFAPER